MTSPTGEIQQTEVPVGPFTFKVRTAGPEDGRLVLLLHGWPQTSYEWRHQMVALADAGFRAVAPDQRGYSPGARPVGVEHYGRDHLVADALAIADWFGAHRFDVVGHDFGAMVAWGLASGQPDRLRTVTAVSVPHPLAFTASLLSGGEQAERSAYMFFFQQPDVPERVLLADGAKVMRAVLTSERLGSLPPDVEGTPGLAHLVRTGDGPAGKHGLDPADIEEYVEVLSEPGAMTAALSWYRAALAGGGSELSAVDVPSLFIWGDGDIAISRDAAERCAEHVTGPYRFEALEGVGHWIPEEAADACSRLILEHFEAHA